MGLFDVFTGDAGKKAANMGYRGQKEGFLEGDKLAGERLGAAETAGQGYLDQGIAPQQALAAQGQQGIDYYGNLLGLNGQEAASQAFQGSPGYQWQQEQGIEALNRAANARGMLASGNNTQDILKYSQGLASQDYYNQLNAAQPYFGLGQGAASGIQGGYTNKAELAANTGGRLADYGWQSQTGIGQAKADRANQVANAEQAGSANTWGAILGLGEAAAKAFAASDARVKTDIKQVGSLDNGLPVYLFRYKAGGPFQLGLMAQDVEEVNPGAVREFDGVKHVLYSAAVN